MTALAVTLAPWRFQLLGYPVGFGRPLFLVLLAVALVLGAWALLVALRRGDRAAQLAPPRLQDRLLPGLSAWRPVVRSALTGLGLLAFAVALARPQCGSHAELTKRRGIDVVVALDASKSMLARDVAPSRIERAKLELTTLLDELKGDRVGIVAFAGEAFVQCPLTSDYDAAKLFLRAVEPAQMPQGGTDIGAALTLAKEVLDGADRGAKERLVVLLSDGEDLSGDVDSALAALADASIQVYAIGIGSETGEPIPLFDRRGDVVGYKKDASGQTVMSRLDRAGLERVAEKTGGELFYEPRGVAVAGVIERIDSMQKSELESRLTVQYAERFQPFVVAGLCFLVAAAAIFPSWRRRT